MEQALCLDFPPESGWWPEQGYNLALKRPNRQHLVESLHNHVYLILHARQAVHPTGLQFNVHLVDAVER